MTTGTPNRLIHEQSPYLQQHARNPVDWYPWGDEALERARREDRPIFLSIGYSTCHWCHVMERESFEDPQIAAPMNEAFVCIKVDREERPDLDEIYMSACQAMTGQGGWPLSVFLTPDLKPFYAGTYFPPDDRFGRPGFPRLVTELSRAYRERRDEVEAAAGRLTGALQRLAVLPAGGDLPGREAVDAVVARLSGLYDPTHGGWGSAPKFPRADYGSLCLRVFRRTGDDVTLRMVLHTLDRMADGGLYDHLGGGFHRYSTDAEWLAPHFEKMLYDNAQLAFHYLEAFQLTREPRYEAVVRGTLDYVLRDLTHPRGGFYSAEDADSEGEEGRFYVWSAAEVERILGADRFAMFAAAYDVTPTGNWEGHTILRRVADDATLAAAHGLDEATVRSRLAEDRERLLAARGERVRPGRDDKILTAWNGLALTAFARAAMVLDEDRYLEAARRAARFCLEEMRDGEGLLRRWREGEAKVPAFAEDHAMLVRGLLELFQASHDLDFLEAARDLDARQWERFGDPADGTLFNTLADQDDLLVRVKTGYDGSIPTPNSVAGTNALLLFELTGEEAYARRAERLLGAFGPTLAERGIALSGMVQTLDAWYAERVELVVAGAPDDPQTLDLFRVARSGYHPDLVTALAPDDDGRAARLMPALAGKAAGEGSLAYVCRGFTCRQPTDDPAALAAQLDLLTREGEDE